VRTMPTPMSTTPRAPALAACCSCAKFRRSISLYLAVRTKIFLSWRATLARSLKSNWSAFVGVCSWPPVTDNVKSPERKYRDHGSRILLPTATTARRTLMPALRKARTTRSRANAVPLGAARSVPVKAAATPTQRITSASVTPVGWYCTGTVCRLAPGPSECFRRPMRLGGTVEFGLTTVQAGAIVRRCR
jgi:hypothetical protein